jgi:hypothetical protein
MIVTTNQTNTPYPAVVSTTDYDPLGRVRLSVDGDGNNIAKAYRYQPNATSLELQSNPYASTSDPTMGWTLTTRDAVGRVTEVDHYMGSAPPAPWGSNTTKTGTTTIQYDQSGSGCAGPTTNVTDEAGNTHINCPDGLGNLVSVTEPNAVSGGAGDRNDLHLRCAQQSERGGFLRGNEHALHAAVQFDAASAVLQLQHAFAAGFGVQSREQHDLLHLR